MPTFSVALRRRWFGEEREEKLAEYDHEPAAEELLALAGKYHLGPTATLYVRPARSKAPAREYRVRDLQPPPAREGPA